MSELKIGSKITYTDENGEQGKGKIHGVRKVDLENGPAVLSYIVDTGKENPDHKGRADRQPEQVDVRPENVEPA